MLASTILMNVVALLLAFQTLASTLETSILGYDIVDTSWDLEVFPGQHMTPNGTIQEAVAQATHINPKFTTGNTTTTARDVSTLKKRRYHDWSGRPKCKVPDFPNWGWANWEAIHLGAQYLDNINDGSKPGAGPGPGECGRVSCEWSSAIYWCNDKTVDRKLNSWSDIADGTVRLLEFCAGLQQDTVAGQQFSNEDWNVIVHMDQC
ncbi:hypothetical protein FKW77_000798 [Venturia effusa]|uniref:Ecp2 effector protein domain-containing protein n=1 Tax=Venturia effusa TaxID=50376 RepID=A0A517LBV0_9PEZI|nr:hypothetical protein FKW77_000798 [Venturia effusa]